MSKPKRERGVIVLKLRRPDFSRMLEFIGCTNDQPVKVGGNVYPAETLLVLPPTCEVRMSRSGFRRWHVIGRLWIRRRGWNTFERGESGDYHELVSLDGHRLTPYRPIDFRELLRGAKVYR